MLSPATGAVPRLISLQGTGAAGPPLTHLRYDYRRIGRATTATILHGRKPWIAPAVILPGKTTRPIHLGLIRQHNPACAAVVGLIAFG